MTAVAVCGTAQAASVTLYGLLDAGLAQTRYTYQGAALRVQRDVTGMRSGLLHATRLGIRGSEDLGGGNKAIFNFEQKIDLTDGASDGGFRRQAWVGLTAGWGTLTLGRQKDIADKYLKIGTVRGQGKPDRSFGSSELRRNGLVKYLSPSMGGLRAGFAWAQGGAAEGSRHFVSTGLQYQHGPLMLAVAWNRERPLDAAGLSRGYSVVNWALGVAYDFVFARVTAGYGQDRNGKMIKPADASDKTLGGFKPPGLDNYQQRGFRSRNHYLGISVPAGSGRFGFAWQHSTARLAGARLATQNLYAAQYLYALSKRTELYVYGAYASGVAYVRGFRGRELALGVLHRF